MTDRFFVEFDRGAGVGGSKLIGELVLFVPKKSKTAKQTADFRITNLIYTFDLNDGHPVQQKYRGKLRISEHDRDQLLLRLDLFKQGTSCHFCKGPAFKRAKGEPPPRQVKHKNGFVWCCPKCREPELPYAGGRR